MEVDIMEAQRRLEEKRTLLMQTEPKRIGSEPDCEQLTGTCEVHCIEVPAHSFSGHTFLSCSKCEEDRVMRLAEQEAEADAKRLKSAHDAKMARIAKRLEALNIGQRFRSCVWGDYKTSTPAMEGVFVSAKDFAADFPRHREDGTNMVLIGSPGTGKNMVAALICMDVVNQGFTAVHTTAIKLVRRIKESWQQGSKETEQEAINNFTAPSLLVIDEIGVQFNTDAEMLFLTEVINDRYEAKRPTILISNLTMAQVESVLGKRAVDRFYEGDSKILVFNWSSFRRKSV